MGSIRWTRFKSPQQILMQNRTDRIPNRSSDPSPASAGLV